VASWKCPFNVSYIISYLAFGGIQEKKRKKEESQSLNPARNRDGGKIGVGAPDGSVYTDVV
jgi:hypothetical protein